jgi:crotonobetaine/carnitine-CoA ligase
MAEEARRPLEPPFEETVSHLLLARAQEEPDRVLLVRSGEAVTLSQIALAASAVATRLRDAGIAPGDPVLTMMDAGPNYIAHFFGIALAGALWVPVSPEAKGPSLAHALSLAEPRLAFVAPGAVPALQAAGFPEGGRIVETDGWTTLAAELGAVGDWQSFGMPDDKRAVLFTSGTSGPPKGVLVTDRMLLASAAGCAMASDCEAGDGYLMWEPMHHVGGPQLVIMALALGAKLVMVRRFSATGFWPDVRRFDVTKLHYLGGILEILLKSQVSEGDRTHPVKLAFGGGCRPEIGRAFEARFGIPIREVYGMTEASSFTTINMEGPLGSVGQAVPWLDVSIENMDGAGAGEIVAAPRFPGLLTPGYLSNPQATERLLRNGALYSGDLGRRDGEGNFYFIGRQSDSFRRRGENISAWEVETALSSHPDIAECAVVGVPSDIGEHDILCFVLLRDACEFDPGGLVAWCRDALPRQHVPRYWKRVAQFERTPSQRIRKDLLNRPLEDVFDAEKVVQ